MGQVIIARKLEAKGLFLEIVSAIRKALNCRNPLDIIKAWIGHKSSARASPCTARFQWANDTVGFPTSTKRRYL